MKLKVLRTDSAEIPVAIRAAVFTLISFVDKKTAKEKKACCDEIKDDMEGNDLSQWFMLFVRVIFRYVYAESELNFDKLISLVKAIDPAKAKNLEQLRNKAGGIGGQLTTLRDQQHSFERNLSIAKEIEVLDEKIQLMRGLFLIVEKIVIILQNKALLDTKNQSSIQEKMLEDPIRFIANLSPILLLLQKGEADDLKNAIQLTMKLIDFKDRELATMVEEELYNQNYIEQIGAAQKISAPSKFTMSVSRVYSFFCCRDASIRVNPSPTQLEPEISSESKFKMNGLGILETILEENEVQENVGNTVIK